MLKRRRSRREFGDVLEGPARPGLLAPRSARPLDEGRQELELLAQALGREAHIVAGMPKLLASHLHTTLLLDEGEEGPAARLLARVRVALAGRPWLRLTNRPRNRGGQSALRGVLEHGGVSGAIAWSPDSRTVASPGKPPQVSLFASSENHTTTVHLWQAATGEPQATLEIDSFQVHTLAWSPDGRSVASGDGEAVRLWDPVGALQSVLEGTAWVVAWSPDGRLLAWGGDERLVRVWHRDGTSPLVVTEHDDRITALAWSPDGRFLASACEELDDKAVRVWDSVAAALMTLSEHRLGVNALAWSPSGAALATAEVDRVRLWYPSTGEEVALEHRGTNVLAIAWSPCGERLASGDYDGIVRVWDTAAREHRVEFDGRGGQVRAVAWSPDGTTVASGSWDGAVRLWRLEEADPAAVLQGHTEYVKTLAWSPDGSTLASTSLDGSVRLWDLERAKQGPVPEGHADDVVVIAWSPNGAVLASAGGMHDNTVRLWDSTTGERVAVFESHTWLFPALTWSSEGVLAHAGPTGPVWLWDAKGASRGSFEWHDGSVDIPLLAWAPRGAAIAVAGGQDDTTIQVWDPSTCERLAVFGRHTSRVGSLAWSPDGRVLASGSKGCVWLWNWAAREAWAIAEDFDLVRIAELAWSPDGRNLAFTDEHALWVCDAATGDERLAAVEIGPLGIGVSRLQWSPDGRSLAVGGSDGAISLWDAITDDEPAVLKGHDDEIDALAWSPDGTLLASGCSLRGSRHDRAVRVWDVATGRCLTVAHCLSPGIALRFDATGRVLQAADGGGSTGNRPIPYVFELSGVAATRGARPP